MPIFAASRDPELVWSFVVYWRPIYPGIPAAFCIAQGSHSSSLLLGSRCTHSHTNHKHKGPLGFSVPPSPWEMLSSPWLLFLLEPRSWGCFPALWSHFPALWSGFPALWSGFPSPVGSLGTAQLGNVFLMGDTHLSAMLLPPKGPPRLSEMISCSSYRKETNPAMHHIGRTTHP